MPIQDSNPERRNLTVTAFSFVIYYLAEGAVVGSEISLPMVNLKFENTEMLAIITWFTLFWFAFRYWQSTRGEVSASYISAIEGQSPPSFVKTYIIKNVDDVGLTEKDNVLKYQFRKRENEWNISFQPVTKVNISQDGVISGHSASSDIIDHVSEFKAPNYILVLSLPFLLVRIFKYNFELVSLISPYLLLFLAIILGVKSCIGI